MRMTSERTGTTSRGLRVSQRANVRPELLRPTVAHSGKHLADLVGRLPHVAAPILDVRRSTCAVEVNPLYQEDFVWQ
jgi:hypothetical protein